MTDDQRKIIEVAANLATIALFLLEISERVSGKRKPRRKAGRHKQNRGKRGRR